MDYGTGGEKLVTEENIMPYGILISLTNEISFYVNETPVNNILTHVKIPCRCAALFAGLNLIKINKIGNLFHAGAAFNEKTGNAPRIHIYMDSPDCKHDPFSQCFKQSNAKTGEYPIEK